MQTFEGFYIYLQLILFLCVFAVDGFDADFHNIVFIGNITQQVEIVVRTVSK